MFYSIGRYKYVLSQKYKKDNTVYILEGVDLFLFYSLNVKKGIFFCDVLVIFGDGWG